MLAAVGPDDIRMLRGARTRAAFAELAGVTPLTVYRWELPDGASEARRPRGKKLARLRELVAAGALGGSGAAGGGEGLAPPAPRRLRPGAPAARSGSAPRDAAAARQAGAAGAAASSAPVVEWASAGPRAASAPSVLAPGAVAEAVAGAVVPRPAAEAALGGAPSAAPGAASSSPAALPALRPAEWEVVLPALASLDEGDAAGAEAHLVTALGSAGELTAAGRALTAIAFAHVQLLGRGSVRGLLLSLPPLLAPDQIERYPALVGAHAHAAGALLYALCPAPWRSPAKVALHASRARARAAAGPDAAKLIARAAAAELLSGPRDAAGSAGALFEAVAAAYGDAGDPLTRCLTAEACAAHLLERGADGRQWEQRAFEHAAQLGLAAPRLRLAALSLPRARLRGLSPSEALQRVAEQRAWRVAEGGGAPGEAELDAAELDALLRLGRLKDAQPLAERALGRLGQRPHAPLALAVIELLRLTAATEPLGRLIAELEAAPPGAATWGVLPCAALARDLGAGPSSVRPHLAALLAPPADAEPAVALDGVLAALAAAVSLADSEMTEAACSELERALAEHPSVWHDAVRRRLLAIESISAGRPAQARGHLEAARAAFERSGDRLQLALLSGVEAAADLAEGRSHAFARVAASVEGLRELGVVPAPPVAGGGRRGAPRAPAAGESSPLERLASQLERLTLRGLSPDQVHQEIAAAAQKLLHPREVRLEPCAPHGGRRPPAGGVELTDGTGQRSILRVEGEASAEQRAALQALSIAGSLALEVAHLRAADAPRPEPPPSGLPAMIAASPSTRALRQEIARLGASKSTVLVRGESGTGKDVVARALHHGSERAAGPYVPFNCASLPRDLFEGQLFGHRKGSFTGATSASEGVIRSAHGGTLFLDEIAELPIEVQPKLLRFLENGEVLPLGETKPTVVDVRVIAATHRDLSEMVRAGSFREDLFYRLNVIRLAIAPLRERPEDMVALARAFLAELTPPGEKPPLLSPDALAALAEHDWPGNVRELRNVMERAVAARPAPRVLGRDHIQLD